MYQKLLDSIHHDQQLDVYSQTDTKLAWWHWSDTDANQTHMGRLLGGYLQHTKRTSPNSCCSGTAPAGLQGTYEKDSPSWPVLKYSAVFNPSPVRGHQSSPLRRRLIAILLNVLALFINCLQCSRILHTPSIFMW